MTGAVTVPESRMFCSRKYPHATANLDAVLRMPSGALAVFEAKTAADCPSKIGEWLGENVPPNYVTQLHQYLGVLDDDRVEGAYIGMLPCRDLVLADRYAGSEYSLSRYFHHFEPRDREYEEEILSAEEDWWHRYAESGVLPAPSGCARLDRQTAERYVPSALTAPEPEPAELSYESYRELWEQLEEAEKEVKTARSRLETVSNFRDSLRNRFAEAMGASREARLVDLDGNAQVILKNTPVFRDSVNLDSLRQYFPEAFEKCRRQTAFTSFSAKVAKKEKKR